MDSIDNDIFFFIVLLNSRGSALLLNSLSIDKKIKYIYEKSAHTHTLVLCCCCCFFNFQQNLNRIKTGLIKYEQAGVRVWPFYIWQFNKTKVKTFISLVSEFCFHSHLHELWTIKKRFDRTCIC